MESYNCIGDILREDSAMRTAIKRKKMEENKSKDNNDAGLDVRNNQLNEEAYNTVL